VLVARSRRTPAVLALPMPSGPFQPPKPRRELGGAKEKLNLIRTINPDFKDFAKAWDGR
jgi:hypothetical protein